MPPPPLKRAHTHAHAHARTRTRARTHTHTCSVDITLQSRGRPTPVACMEARLLIASTFPCYVEINRNHAPQEKRSAKRVCCCWTNRTAQESACTHTQHNTQHTTHNTQHTTHTHTLIYSFIYFNTYSFIFLLINLFIYNHSCNFC